MNRQSDVIENWEYGLLTLLNNALNLPVSEKNDAIEVKSIIEDVSRKLDSDSIQKMNGIRLSRRQTATGFCR